jgi:phage protein D
VSGNPKPAWRVTLDGRDLTAKLRPRLIDLSITSCREDTADQLDIRLDDADGRLAIPPRNAVLRVWLGWDGELTDKGSFTVDEVEHGGAPDVLTLRARSANLRSDLRAQREQSYHATTCGAIVDELAGRNGLTPKCHPSLAGQAVDHIDQTNESDVNFLNRLGKRYDAVATIKAGALIFSPIGAGTTASGKPLPAITITRASGDQHRWHAADRNAYSGVRARYQDVGAGKTGDVIAGTDNGKGLKTLRHTYATKANALRAARSEFQKIQRGAVTFDITLARGRADVYPEQHATVRGFKADIDGSEWIVVRVEDRLGDAGYTTSLELECKPAGVDNAPESIEGES